MFKKLGDALNVIKVLLAIVALIRPLLAQVEVPGFGADKKAAVLTCLGSAIDLLPWAISAEVKETALKIVGGFIDVILGVLNLLGHDWKKKLDSEVSE